MSDFCSKCGKAFAKSDQFCSQCGLSRQADSFNSRSSHPQWEYHEVFLNFSQQMILRSTVHPNARILNDTHQPEIPLSSLQWRYDANANSEGSLENMLYRFRRDVWWYVESLLTDELNMLAEQGWQMTKALDYRVLECTGQKDLGSSAGSFVFATIFGPNHLRIGYYVSLTGARLPLRRLSHTLRQQDS